MVQEKNMGLTVKKDENFSEWYTQAVLKSELADYSAIKGCMVIRPHGYAIWERIQAFLDKRIKDYGVQNAYFPLFIPESFFTKEAEHADGFAPEVAWIANREDSDDRLAVRPTSETIMYDMYSKWLRSHRDLPIKINQWCNVVRWETKATKLFLRTREFLWQEGHCVYATEGECDRETEQYLEYYRQVAEDLLCVPVTCGKKTESEKFAGANYTLTIEGLMPDGRALQMGTSHNLGTRFAKSFGISFLGRDEKRHLPWQNSWGLSTRTIGGLVMVHGDDKGLVLPPDVAPVQVAIVPIIFDKTKDAVMQACVKLKEDLKGYSVCLDDRDEYSSGWKFNEWELKGVPLRIELGPKDLEKDQAVLVRRDTGDKVSVKRGEVPLKVKELFDAIRKDMFAKARKQMDDLTVEAYDWDTFVAAIDDKKRVKTHFCLDAGCEAEIKDKTGAYTRCIPFGSEKPEGKCVHCGKEAQCVMYFAKQY